MARFLKPDITATQNLATGSLSKTTSIDHPFRLDEITCKFSGNTTENITVTRISSVSSSYNVVLKSVTFSAGTSWAWRPDNDCNFQLGEEVKVEITNANLSNVAYLTIKTSEIGG